MRDLYDVRGWRSRIWSFAAPPAPGTAARSKRSSRSGEHSAPSNARAAWSTAGAAFVHRDESFHQRLAEAAANEFAIELLGDINDRIRILRIYDFTSHERITATIHEHLEIVRAVLAGDSDTAAGFMRAHVQRSANVVRERIGEALTKMFDAAPVDVRSSGSAG